jgi:hypothetical protein
LKSILMDFYSAECIAAAKELLFNDLQEVKSDKELPQFIRRRDSPNRLTVETEDLFKFVTFVDENKLIDHLPIYAISNVDDIPAARLYEGDLEPFLRKLDTTVVKVSDLGQRLAAISNQVSCLQRDLRRLLSPQVATGTTGVTTEAAQATSVTSAARTTTTTTTLCEGLWPSLPRQVINNKQLTSTPAHRPSFSRTSSTSSTRPDSDADANEADTNTDQREFTVVGGKRQNKRLRFDELFQSELGPTLTTAASRSHAGKSPETRQNHNHTKHGSRLLTGKRPASGDTGQVSASAKFQSAEFIRPQRKKVVFCIDNVSIDSDISSVRQFIVDDLDVGVVSLFEVKPRRRRFDPEGQFRRAYRVCIYLDNVDRFLMDEKWPDHVNVFEWFFKGDSNPSIRKTTAHTLTPAHFNDRSPARSAPEVSQRGGSNIFNVLSIVDSVTAQVVDTLAAVNEAAGPQAAVAATCEPLIVNSGGGTEWSAEMDASDSVQEINLSTEIGELGDTTIMNQSIILCPQAEKVD